MQLVEIPVLCAVALRVGFSDVLCVSVEPNRTRTDRLVVRLRSNSVQTVSDPNTRLHLGPEPAQGLGLA